MGEGRPTEHDLLTQYVATKEERRTLGMEIKLSLWLWALSLAILNCSTEAGTVQRYCMNLDVPSYIQYVLYGQLNVITPFQTT